MRQINFKRVIKSGKFIPEIDGLRFIAIISVLIYHLNTFIQEKNIHVYQHSYNSKNISSFITHGYLGVELFFAISGFILSAFFAKVYLRNQNNINIKGYFIRRLTRIEPPYIITMLLMFIACVFIVKNINFIEGIKSLISSLFYVHNFVYGNGILPKLNAVAWSLEIEVQFYILMPLLSFIFILNSKLWRRFILITFALCFPLLIKNLSLSFISILDYFQFFIVGILICDLYYDSVNLFKIKNSSVSILTTVLLFVLYFHSENLIAIIFRSNSPLSFFYTNLIQVFSLISIFYLVLFNNGFPLLKNSFITNIGGACYSIYLIHYPTISFFGNYLLKYKFSNYKILDDFIFGSILLLITLFFSMLFYILIERPSMKKDWYLNLKDYFV